MTMLTKNEFNALNEEGRNEYLYFVTALYSAKAEIEAAEFNIKLERMYKENIRMSEPLTAKEIDSLKDMKKDIEKYEMRVKKVMEAAKEAVITQDSNETETDERTYTNGPFTVFKSLTAPGYIINKNGKEYGHKLNLNEALELAGIPVEEYKIMEIYEDIRRCSICNAPMIDGYCFEDGFQYGCNDKCRDQICDEFYNTTWEELYSDEGDSYYTEWYDEYNSKQLEKIMEMINEELLNK